MYILVFDILDHELQI